MRLEA